MLLPELDSLLGPPLVAVGKVRPDSVLLELCEDRRPLLSSSNDLPRKPIDPLGELVVKKPLTLLNPMFWFVEVNRH